MKLSTLFAIAAIAFTVLGLSACVDSPYRDLHLEVPQAGM